MSHMSHLHKYNNQICFHPIEQIIVCGEWLFVCPTTLGSPIRIQNETLARSVSEKADAFADHLQKVLTPNISPSTNGVS